MRSFNFYVFMYVVVPCTTVAAMCVAAMAFI